MQRFNSKKLNEEEGEEKYRVNVSNRFVALEDLDTEAEIIVLGKGGWAPLSRFHLMAETESSLRNVVY
jgi:hypothetical protein